MEVLKNYLNAIRRDFADKPFTEKLANKNPFKQFETWFEEAVNVQILDPFAMAVSTVNKEGQPSTRIVYLRDITENGFIFYTNYSSKKGQDLLINNKISLNFFWGELERQIRIEGEVKKVNEQLSDDYFSKRPRESQIGAWASLQSETITSRKELEDKVKFYTNKFKNKTVPRPKHWGGYIVTPHRIEFWQGRPSRLHDRLVYRRVGLNWEITRVSP